MKIYSYTVIYSSTAEFQDRTPYVAAILENEDGSRVSAILDGYTEGQTVEIGMPVKVCTGTDGEVSYCL